MLPAQLVHAVGTDVDGGRLVCILYGDGRVQAHLSHNDELVQHIGGNLLFWQVHVLESLPGAQH